MHPVEVLPIASRYFLPCHRFMHTYTSVLSCRILYKSLLQENSSPMTWALMYSNDAKIFSSVQIVEWKNSNGDYNRRINYNI